MKRPFPSLLIPALALLASTQARAGLAEATDFPGTWTSGSDNGGIPPSSPQYWTDQGTTTIDGIDAADGRLGGNNASVTWMQTTVTGPTTLYFSYRVKSLSGPYPGGGFFLVVNGDSTLLSPSTLISEDRGWLETSAVIPAGAQTVKWMLSYMRGSTGGHAYIDQVWTSDDPRPRLTDTAMRAGTFGSAFSWTVPVASSTAATLAATGLPPGLTVDADAHVIAGTPTEAGNFEATLTAINASGQHIAKVKFEVEPGNTTIPEGVEATGLVFTQSAPGTAWRGATGFGHDGVDCARGLGGPDTFQGSQNTLSTTLNGPGSLTFWYRGEASQSIGGDNSFIRLYVGIPASSQQPTQQLQGTSWTQATVPIPAGPQTVSWKALWVTAFATDATQRFVYLDELAFAPSTVPPQPTFSAWQAAWNVVGQPTTTDADGDGLTLPMEYAVGGSPYTPNPELVPVVSVSAGYFTINVIKAPSPTDLLYFVQASKDLGPNSWTTSSVEVADEDGTHILAHCKKPISEQPISYLRVRVLVAPP